MSGNGQGSSKKVAQTLCALSIVRQLFHMGILGPADQQNVPKKPTASAVSGFFLLGGCF